MRHEIGEEFVLKVERLTVLNSQHISALS